MHNISNMIKSRNWLTFLMGQLINLDHIEGRGKWTFLKKHFVHLEYTLFNAK
jgi:hypothetical protein